MPSTEPNSARRRSYALSRRMLLASVSTFALSIAAGSADAGNLLQGNRAVSPVSVASAQVAASAQQAAILGQQAKNSLAVAAQALQARQAAQSAARNLALSAPSAITDGLGGNGLVPNPNVVIDPSLWQGANLPTQATVNGRIEVDIQQTKPKAILNWQNFNVGKNTTLDYLQGGSDWVALNRIGATGAPSQILGQIKAPGAVYLINPNGIIFGGSSQVNVHALVASVLDVGAPGMSRSQRDQSFLNNGIASQVGVEFSSTFSAPISNKPTPPPIDTDGSGNPAQISVQSGATIATDVVAPDSPGFIYLFGPNVVNEGTLTSPEGEVALVAARTVTLLPGQYDARYNAATNAPSTSSISIRGTGFGITPYPTLNSNGGVDATQYASGTGLVRNDGLIATPAGTTILNGDQIVMSGVISADTTISRNSSVFIDAATSVDLSGTVSVLPTVITEEDAKGLPLIPSAVASGSTVQTFVPPTVEASAYDVTLEPSGMISAPGASVTLTGLGIDGGAGNFQFAPNAQLIGPTAQRPTSLPERVLLAAGATIDVAGLQDVQLPASYNVIAFQPHGNEFADDPLQRDGPLAGQTLFIDIRNTGTRSDGSTWIGTPLANASGFVGLVGQSIFQLLTNGGTVNFKTDIVNPKPGQADVILQPGSLINMRGGFVEFLPGFVPNTRLIGSDGHIYDISQADPNLTYVGIAGQFSVTHPRWGLTETWTNPLLAGPILSPGYIEGHNAGALSVTALDYVPGATLLFGASSGQRQIVAGSLPSQGSYSLFSPSSVVISDVTGPALPNDFSATTLLLPPAVPLPSASTSFTSNSPFQLDLAANNLSSYGLSTLNITANDLVLTQGSTLNLAPGGQFIVKAAGAIDIEGTASAQGGQISLTTDGFGLSGNGAHPFPGVVTRSGRDDLLVGSRALLDARGRWANDTGLDDSQMSGPAFINGGTIALTTDDSTAGAQGQDGDPDTTGNIVLAPGSKLDVSSGGYINQRGAIKTSSSFVLAGRGGNIALQIYQGSQFIDITGQGGFGPALTKPGPLAAISLEGTISGFGFSGGGNLTITAPGIQLGGSPPADTSTLQLPTSFFASQGFGSYSLGAGINAPRGSNQVTLAQNQNLLLRQLNFSNTADYRSVPTGAEIEEIAPLTVLPDDLRAPVNLNVSAAEILLDSGSSITADAAATITLAGGTPSSAALLLGSITDHGGTLSVSSGSIWLGSRASFDLSGTFIANSNFAQSVGVAQSGTLLPGGTVTFDTSAGIPSNGFTTGFMVAESGASVDVSGASAVITGRSTGSSVTTVPSWSDAGTVNINAGGLFWDGAFKAAGGAPQANGGTLALGGTTVVLSQDNGSIQPALDFLTSRNPSTPTDLSGIGSIISGTAFARQDFVPVDHLGAFDTVYLYAGSGSSKIFTSAAPADAGPLQITGNVDWSVRNRLFIEANNIVAETPQSHVNLSAAYVMLADPIGGLPKGALPSPDQSKDPANPTTLTVSANTIDIQSAVLSGFGEANFSTSGNIRLSTPPFAGNQSVFFGQLVSGGDLNLSAQRTYPVSGVDFEIVSTSPSGEVRFSAPAGGVPTVPLSAGGSLTVAAATIDQAGNLLAPLGEIVLGAQTPADLSANDPNRATPGYFVATNKVTLEPGSRTSVSLNNLLVPFGQTEDGTNWFYNTDVAPLTLPPGKTIRLLGTNVSTNPGATIDLRGGGDLQAIEFVPGLGGSRDVLTTGPNGQAVYALLPSENDPVAAFDIDFVYHLGDTQPLAGQQIFLAGGNGIAAGFYTLYPSHYATLPGALRVVDVGSALAKPGQAGATLADGTQLIAGFFGQSNFGLRTSGTEIFAVQTSAVWRQYSEIDGKFANGYFATQAARNGVVAPPLPIDAGRLAVSALGTAPSSLTLGATINAQPAATGRGGELDIAGNQLDLVGPSETPATGFTGIDVAQLDALGIESILIGGRRTDEASGTVISATASDVRVDDSDLALTAPELIVVAEASTTLEKLVGGGNVELAVPRAGSGEIEVNPGSSLVASGTVASALGRHYLLGSPVALASFLATTLGGTLDTTGTVINNVDESKLTSAQISQVANYGANLGVGSALLLSNDPQVSVAPPAPQIAINFVSNGSAAGSLVLPVANNIGTLNLGGALIEGGQNLVLGAGVIHTNPTTSLSAKAITVTTSSIGIGDASETADGFLISSALMSELNRANSLTLRTISGGISFFSDVGIAPVGADLRNLTLDTPFLAGTGQSITVGGSFANADGSVADQLVTIALTNSGTATATTTAATVPGSTLILNAGEIDLLGNNQTIAGFGSVNWATASTPTSKIFAEGAGTITIGADRTPVDLTLTTPNFLIGGGTSGTVGSGTQLTISTLGNFSLKRPPQATTSLPGETEIGGNVLITAASIQDQGTMDALSGTITLHATGAASSDPSSGSVDLAKGSLVAVGGVARSFVDFSEFSPGGKVALISDNANVSFSTASTIDLSGGPAAAGALDVSAASGAAIVNGTIHGSGPRLGGTFRLNAQTVQSGGSGTTLDNLATLLAQGGMTGDVEITTGRDDLILSAGQTLRARAISLTANDPNAGEIIINGTLDASAPEGSGFPGGSASVYGANAISLGSTGAILATTTQVDQRGGDVVLGLGPVATGVIDLQAGSTIAVNGGTAGGLSGGTVRLRAPLVTGRVFVKGINNGADYTLGVDTVDSNNIAGDDVRVGSIASAITGVRSLTIEDYLPISTDGEGFKALGWDGIIDPAGLYDKNGNLEPTGTINPLHQSFYTVLVPEFVEGLIQGFGFTEAIARLKPAEGTPQAKVFQLQPGIEFDNPDPNINHGDITVASNWNLAAGVAVDKNGIPLASGAAFTRDDAIRFLYRFGLDPGTLTLRAVRDVNVNASITDGFFQFGNYLDPNYIAAVQSYIAHNTQQIGANGLGGAAYFVNSFKPAPVAPYDPNANVASPMASASNPAPIAGADLFPSVMNVVDNTTGQVDSVAEGSWTYRITAGADFTSANPNAVGPLTTYGDTATIVGGAGHGNVVINNHTSYSQWVRASFGSITSVPVNVPTVLRTGTGSIAISAARDVILADQSAPGAIYTAGLNAAPLPDPQYAVNSKTNLVVAGNASGFLEPQLLAYGTLAIPDGPLTAAAFPEGAGDIAISAQQDIIGFQNVVSNNVPQYQFFAPWLLSMAQTTPSLFTAEFGSGAFSPATAAQAIAEQSSWWVEFGSFDQGVLSGGGNVTIDAGRDLRDFSASLPSTGRASGGLAAGNTPITHTYGSGNLVVRVGRNLDSGSFYEGSGQATITVAGTVGSDWIAHIVGQSQPNLPNTFPVATVLAVDSGQLSLTAGGSIAITDIVNPAELHAQNSKTQNQPGIVVFMDTYGANSAVNLTSIGGDVALSANANLLNNGPSQQQAVRQTYPATLDIAALSGNITTPATGLVLADSESGQFNLVAQGTLDLSGGVAHTTNNFVTAFGPTSAGGSLIDAGFNAYEPNNGFDDATSTPILAHSGGVQLDRLYALTGEILGGGIVEIDQPVAVRAGQDIVDLNLTAQNILPTDVSAVTAGRDLFYTGLANAGGLQIAGPGYFAVAAGRNLGPFLPAAGDTAKTATVQEGIVSSGNTDLFAIGDDSAVQPIGPLNPEFLGAIDPATHLPIKDKNTGAFIGKRNFLLSDKGASIVALFGVGPGIDYQAVIDAYINPANAASVPHNYLPELQNFLSGLGIATSGPGDAFEVFSTQLTPQLQEMFVLQVYFAELKAPADSNSPSFKQYQRGYEMVNTLFPAPFGYTANSLSGGTNGANQLVKTGDLNLLHATIQTQRGGTISLLGPGGDILVGSTATEPNPNLKPNNLGILTLDRGSVFSFTDGSLLVNSSRLFTEEGGDLVLWSSNGDIDAGRGARTTISFPALQVEFSPDDDETIDLGGLVTGAGIATLKTSAFADSVSSDAFIAAPRGAFNLGEAGSRIAGNLSVAAQVIVHAQYLEVSGKAEGVPTVAAPNTQALSQASGTSGAAASAAEASADQARRTREGQELPSIITVEVLGYGGGDQPDDDDRRRR